MEESLKHILLIVLKIDSSLTDLDIDDIMTAVFDNLSYRWQEFLVEYHEEERFQASNSKNEDEDEDDENEFEQFLANVDTYYDATEISAKDIERERVLDEIFMSKLNASVDPAFHEHLILLNALCAVCRANIVYLFPVARIYNRNDM